VQVGYVMLQALPISVTMQQAQGSRSCLLEPLNTTIYALSKPREAEFVLDYQKLFNRQ